MIEIGGASGVDPRLSALLASLDEVTTELAGYDLSPLVRLQAPSAELVAAGHRVERARRRLSGFDTGYVHALEQAGEPARHGATSTATFLRHQLRLSPAEARRRVTAARACADRDGFSQAEQGPRLPTLAAARLEGSVSDEHTEIVIRTLDAVPGTVPADRQIEAEEALVEDATHLDPPDLAKVARRLVDCLDPDGTLRDHDWQEQVRSATLVRRHDGAGDLRARLTPAAHEALATCLQALAKPVPTGPAGPDQRRPDQRLHDALLDLALNQLRAGDLPACGGTPATVLLLVDAPTATPVTSQPGADAPGLLDAPLVTTGLGSLLAGPAARSLGDEALVYTVLRDSKGVPLHLGRASRIATPGQTIALAARDRGCSFPGCDRPPSWTQRHHIKAWANGGPTNLDNLTLLCGHHHRNFQQLGWQCLMLHGRPWWRPPTWIDPKRQPIRNTHWDTVDTG